MAISLNIQKKIYELGQQIPVLSDREVARRLSVSRDSAAKYRGALPSDRAIEEQESLISPDLHIAQAKAMERLRVDNGRLRAMNRLLTRAGAVVTVEEILEQFREELALPERSQFVFKPKVYPIPARTKDVFDPHHEEIATLVLSDWHGSETIRLDETSGVNKYGSIIMANRAYALVDKFKRIVRGHQGMYTVSKLLVLLLGDFIHGSIHPENILTNDLLDVPAAILVAKVLVLVFEDLKTLGLPIEVECTVGNHPRIGLAKMPTKRQAQTSFDWVVYTLLEQAFAHDPQVAFRIHKGQFGITDQLGHRVVIEHGYGASGQVDMVSKVRSMYDNPVYREATGMTGASVDYIVIGDKHRAQTGEGYLVNGCLSGSNELGVAWRLSPIGAIQYMFGVSAKHIPTWTYPLSTQDVLSDQPDNPYSAYATQFMAENGR